MLVASILRCFYWLGVNFEKSLLLQSLVMIVVQLTLLKVALDNRPVETSPFAGVTKDVRPYSFWQWRAQRPSVFPPEHSARVTNSEQLLGISRLLLLRLDHSSSLLRFRLDLHQLYRLPLSRH